jgi:hypothetical protein
LTAWLDLPVRTTEDPPDSPWLASIEKTGRAPVRYAQKLRETPKRLRPENEINVPERPFYFFRRGFLLNHAAAKGNDLLGFFSFRMNECADISVNAHFGVLADGARVDDDKVRFRLLIGEAVSHGVQHAPQLFAVGLVLLTAVRVNKSKRGVQRFCVFFTDPLHDGFCAVNFLLWDSARITSFSSDRMIRQQPKPAIAVPFHFSILI